jgi:hypothetical protein
MNDDVRASEIQADLVEQPLAPRVERMRVETAVGTVRPKRETRKPLHGMIIDAAENKRRKERGMF